MSASIVPNIIPVQFTRPGVYGDFSAMINDDEYENDLFIYNDNVEDHNSAGYGKGNAVIRPYNKHGIHKDYPRSAGIPTGFSRRTGGFTSLTPQVKRIIDCAIRDIKKLQSVHQYENIFFSADPAVGKDRPLLGTAIFRIGDDVRTYITDQIYSLGDYVEDL